MLYKIHHTPKGYVVRSPKGAISFASDERSGSLFTFAEAIDLHFGCGGLVEMIPVSL